MIYNKIIAILEIRYQMYDAWKKIFLVEEKVKKTLPPPLLNHIVHFSILMKYIT